MSTPDEREIPIPHFYLGFVKGARDPGRLFRRYVAAYVRNTHPGWQLVRIKGMKAVIEQIKQ